jgi:hypothetical protein
MAMEPYSEHAAAMYKLHSNDDWLRRRQGLALPALPPTTNQARQYFFTKIREFSTLASDTGKRTIDYGKFAQEWNQSADGITCFYITPEVLGAYAKTWEKINNVRASKELISDRLETIRQSSDIFAASSSAFPACLTGSPSAIHPIKGVIDLEQVQPTPSSLSTQLAISHPSIPLSTSSFHQLQSTSTVNTAMEVISDNPDQALQEIGGDTRYIILQSFKSLIFILFC